MLYRAIRCDRGATHREIQAIELAADRAQRRVGPCSDRMQRVIDRNTILRPEVEKHPTLLIDLAAHPLNLRRRFVARFGYAKVLSFSRFASGC